MPNKNESLGAIATLISKHMPPRHASEKRGFAFSNPSSFADPFGLAFYLQSHAFLSASCPVSIGVSVGPAAFGHYVAVADSVTEGANEIVFFETADGWAMTVRCGEVAPSWLTSLIEDAKRMLPISESMCMWEWHIGDNIERMRAVALEAIDQTIVCLRGRLSEAVTQ